MTEFYSAGFRAVFDAAKEEFAAEIERLREALREYVATVVYEEGVTFIDRMPTAELRLLVESVSKEDK